MRSVSAVYGENNGDFSTYLILSDRGVDEHLCPIPALLATAGVHHHLMREGTRVKAGLILESGEPREVHHMAVLLGFGAGAINPYLAFETSNAKRILLQGGLGKGWRKLIARCGLAWESSPAATA